jgi:phospholipid/cholesterol/gamma-HCH transport system substrate-binding protein
MEYRSQEIKAGLLVVVSVGVLVAFLVIISGVDLERKENLYTARFGFSAGIEPGSLVRFGGMLIGAVEQSYIAPDDNTKIEVILRVDAKAPIKTDSYAFISSINLMGDYYVEITTGTPTAALLPSGSRLRSKEVATLSQLGGPLTDLSAEAELLLHNFNALLDEKNRAHISNMVANADTLLTRNMQDISGIVANLKLLTEQLQSLSAKIDKLMGDNTASLELTLRQMHKTLARTDTLMYEMSITMQAVNNLVTANQSAFYEAMQNMQDASRNFQQFSRSIKERPWNLVRKSEPEERKLP